MNLPLSEPERTRKIYQAISSTIGELPADDPLRKLIEAYFSDKTISPKESEMAPPQVAATLVATGSAVNDTVVQRPEKHESAELREKIRKGLFALFLAQTFDPTTEESTAKKRIVDSETAEEKMKEVDQEELARLLEGSTLEKLIILAKPKHKSPADFSTFTRLSTTELSGVKIINTEMNVDVQLLWSQSEGSSDVVMTLKMPGKTSDAFQRPAPVIVHCVISAGEELTRFIKTYENDKSKLDKVYLLLAILIQENMPELMGLLALPKVEQQGTVRCAIKPTNKPLGNLSLRSPSKLPQWVLELNDFMMREVRNR